LRSSERRGRQTPRRARTGGRQVQLAHEGCLGGLDQPGNDGANAKRTVGKAVLSNKPAEGIS
ncbi:MAG TPA: hypothetical protein VK137_08200, partial [Planctomycetaceae bacterium]|nr:hypothetical protein [Planctomycetaceae bacterium]